MLIVYNNRLLKISQRKNINNQINGNIDEILEQSDFINNKIDVNNRHKDNDIISFDTREAKIYDGNQAYKLTLSIAELSNGEKVGYAKKFLRPDSQLTQEIKKEVSTSSTSKNERSSRMTTSSNSITSHNNDVNTTTKYSMQDDYHTGIRNIEDIKTFEETLQDNDWADYDEYNPDYTSSMAEDAIKNCKK